MNRACARAREMLKPFGKKTNTAKRALRVLAVPLAACALMFGATSASADQAVPFGNHTVQTVNPTGTTVNLFDYWVVDGDNDSSANINNDNGNNNTGINKDHQLKFNGGAGSGINKWTGKSDIGGFGRLSFVKNTLVNGYPSIKPTPTPPITRVVRTPTSRWLISLITTARSTARPFTTMCRASFSSKTAITFMTRMARAATTLRITSRLTPLTSTIRRAYIRTACRMRIGVSSSPLTRLTRFLKRGTAGSLL